MDLLAPQQRPLRLHRPIWSWAALIRFAAVGAVATLVLTVLGLLIDQRPPALDVDGVEAVARIRGDVDVTIAHTLSFLADFQVVAAITVVLAAISWRRTRALDIPWLVTAAVMGALLVTGAVKLLTDRTRPDGGLADSLSSSFPSGHSVRGVVVYGLLAWLLARWLDGVTRTIAVGVAVLLAVTTALSRVWLSVHWPTDIVAGAIFGLVWLVACLRITGPYRPPPPDAVPADAPPTDGPAGRQQTDRGPRPGNPEPS